MSAEQAKLIGAGEPSGIILTARIDGHSRSIYR